MLQDELEIHDMLGLLAFTQSMPTVTFLDLVVSGMTLNQRLDGVHENYSKEEASNP